MASLTTVYFLSLILASFAGMGSGWYGSSMNGGSSAPIQESNETTVPEIEPPPNNTEQTEPPTSEESVPNPPE